MLSVDTNDVVILHEYAGGGVDKQNIVCVIALVKAYLSMCDLFNFPASNWTNSVSRSLFQDPPL